MDIKEKEMLSLMFFTCAVLYLVQYFEPFKQFYSCVPFTESICYVEWRSHGFIFISVTFIFAKLSAFYHVQFFSLHFQVFVFSFSFSYLYLSFSLCVACVSVLVCVNCNFTDWVLETAFSFGEGRHICCCYHCVYGS